MRLSREVKAEHHEEITLAASRMLRVRGIEQTSLSDLMQSVGLTHGGFYRHFKSKDELVALATSKAFGEVASRFEKRTAEVGPKAALVAYVVDYLSEEHRDDPSQGCMISACGSEAPRQDGVVREVFSQGVEKLIDLAAGGLRCSDELRAERALELGALMLGALIMARATNDARLSEAILASARKRAFEIIEKEA